MARFLLVAAMLFAAGCQYLPPDTPTPSPIPEPPPAAQPAPSSTQPRPTTPSPVIRSTPPLVAAPSPALSPSPSPAVAAAPCAYGPSRRIARLQNRDISEASALAASWRTPDVYWTLNDSGNDPVLFAFDAGGRDLGAFRVEDARNNDWEALEIGPGRDGQPAFYIGDIGDNDARRKEIQIYRTPEPVLDPRAAKPQSTALRPVERFSFVYPDGPRDAEALLVHPTSGEIAIVSKSFSGRSRVYRAPQPLTAERRATLEFVAELDFTSAGLFAGAVGDAAYAPDGRRLVLRTYTTAFEYDVPADPNPAAVWGQRPRVYPLDDPPQGEGISYRRDGRALLTIVEHVPAGLFQNECQ